MNPKTLIRRWRGKPWPAIFDRTGNVSVAVTVVLRWTESGCADETHARARADHTLYEMFKDRSMVYIDSMEVKRVD